MGVQLPLLQSLSETLQAAAPIRRSISALKTIRSPGLERGRLTQMLPSGWISVYLSLIHI